MLRNGFFLSQGFVMFATARCVGAS
jgi:hypothetical protein